MVSLFPHSNQTVSVQLAYTSSVQKVNPATLIQAAIKNSVGAFYFTADIPIEMLFGEDGLTVDIDDVWNDYTSPSTSFEVNATDSTGFLEKLKQHRIFARDTRFPVRFFLCKFN
jgi:hypothetical protein